MSGNFVGKVSQTAMRMQLLKSNRRADDDSVPLVSDDRSVVQPGKQRSTFARQIARIATHGARVTAG
jgi:hypothetical protein